MKSNSRDGSDAPELDVVRFPFSDWHFGARHTRHSQHQLLKPVAHALERRLELLYLGSNLLALFDEGRAIVLFGLGDERAEARFSVPFSARARLGLSPFLVGGQELVEVEIEAFVLDGGADEVGLLADELDVEHRLQTRECPTGHPFSMLFALTSPRPRACAPGSDRAAERALDE